MNLGRYLRPGAPPEKRWTAAALALLGTMPEEQLGRTAAAVRVQRTRLGIASACDRRRKGNRA